MKQTQKHLTAGIALLIALFSSTDTFSMEQTDTNLTSLNERVKRLEHNLNTIANSMSKIEDPDNGFVQRNEFISTVKLIVEQINHAGKILDVLGTLFTDTGILTIQELQQRIRDTKNKAVGLQMQ